MGKKTNREWGVSVLIGVRGVRGEWKKTVPSGGHLGGAKRKSKGFGGESGEGIQNNNFGRGTDG